MHRSESRIISDKGEEIAFSNYFDMENLFEKLKILNYYSEFVISLKMKPINEFYFMIPKNSGEQFFLFSSLAAWLIRKLGKHFEDPHEHDDPNNIIANILQVIREDGTKVEFPPNKLKQGVGGNVVFVLNKLCDKILERKENESIKPEIVEEKETDEEQNVIEDESELILDQIEEEMLAAYSDDSDEENIAGLDINFKSKINSQNTEINIKSDMESWRIELERVLPQLKLIIKSSNHDWRSRLDHMKNNYSQIKQLLVSARNQLVKLQKEIGFSLEKVQNRERYINKEMEVTLKEYIVVLNQLSKIKEEYNAVGSGVTEKTRQLAELNSVLERHKQSMEERGNSMINGTPLVNIKKSISKVKLEITEMDTRIGVLECCLLQVKMREKMLLEEDLNHAIKSY